MDGVQPAQETALPWSWSWSLQARTLEPHWPNEKTHHEIREDVPVRLVGGSVHGGSLVGSLVEHDLSLDERGREERVEP